MSIIKDSKIFDATIGRFQFVKPSEQAALSEQNGKELSLFKQITSQCKDNCWTLEITDQSGFLCCRCSLGQLAVLLNLSEDRCLEYLHERRNTEGKASNSEENYIPAHRNTLFWVSLFFLSLHPLLVTIQIRANIITDLENLKVHGYKMFVRCNVKENRTWNPIVQEIHSKFLQSCD
jgi:hypothetical protein